MSGATTPPHPFLQGFRVVFFNCERVGLSLSAVVSVYDVGRDSASVTVSSICDVVGFVGRVSDESDLYEAGGTLVGDVQLLQILGSPLRAEPQLLHHFAGALSPLVANGISSPQL